MSVQNWRRDSGSTPPVGSSRKTIGGSWRIAQPSARRCRQPPARSAARVCSRPSQAGHVDDERAGASSSRAPVEPVDAAEEPDVLIDGQLLVEREALRHVADAALDAFGIAADVDAVDRGRAARRLQQPAQHADRRGLAGAVAAEKAEDLALAARRTTRDRRRRSRRSVRVRSVTVMAFIGPSARCKPRVREAARWRAPACDRAAPGGRATCASSTSVLVATPAANRSPTTRLRLGRRARPRRRPRRCAARLDVDLRDALPDLERQRPSRARRAAPAWRALDAAASATSAARPPAVEQRPADVDAGVPRLLPAACAREDARVRAARSRRRPPTRDRRPPAGVARPAAATRRRDSRSTSAWRSRRAARAPAPTSASNVASRRRPASSDGVGLIGVPGGSADEPRELGFGDVARRPRLDAQHALARLLRLDGQHVVRRHEPGVELIAHVAQVRADARRATRRPPAATRRRRRGPERARDLEPQIGAQRRRSSSRGRRRSRRAAVSSASRRPPV